MQIEEIPASKMNQLTEIPVFRVAPYRDPGTESKWWLKGKGYSASLSMDELKSSLDGWYRCDKKSIENAGIVIVTVSGYVVSVLSNVRQEEERVIEGKTLRRFRFNVSGMVKDLANEVFEFGPRPEDIKVAKMLLGTWLPTESGGTVAYIKIPNE